MPQRILIAEDDEVQSAVLRSALEQRGYQAEIVSDGLAAVRRLRAEHFDLALLDYHMPEVDGLAAARLMHDFFPDDTRPRLIALTVAAEGLSDRETVCGSTSFDAVVSKRAGLSRLLTVVDENLVSAAQLQAFAKLEISGRATVAAAAKRRRRWLSPVAALPALAMAGAFLAAFGWAAESLTTVGTAADATQRAAALGTESAALVGAVQNAETSGEVFLASGLAAHREQFNADAQHADQLLASSTPFSMDGTPGFAAGDAGQALVQDRLRTLSQEVQSRTVIDSGDGAAGGQIAAGRAAADSLRSWATGLVSGSQVIAISGLAAIGDNVRWVLFVLAGGIGYGLWNALRAVQRRWNEPVAAPGAPIEIAWQLGVPLALKASRASGPLLLHDG